MKKRLFLILSLVFVIAFVFAISASAEVFNLTYYQENTMKETVKTDQNGQITLRDTGYSTETSDKTLLGWFTYEGDMYKPGETITLTKDTNIYQFFGFKGTQKNFQTTQSQWSSTYIQLQEDVVFENAISWDDGGKLFVDLNGYTITSSAGSVFSQRRAGLTIVGEGSIIHTGNDAIFRSEIHGYDDRRVSMYIGKNVKVETTGVVYNWVNSINSGWINDPVPFEVYGDITCKQLMAVNGTTAEVLNIVVKPKRLEITGESLFSFKTYPTEALINVQIGGLTFILNESANLSSFWNNDNSQCYNITVTGGTFTNGGSIIEAFLSDEYTTLSNEINGVNYTTVILKGTCVHEYEVSGKTSATCVAYASETYTCKKCQDTYTVFFDVFAEHDWKLISEIKPTVSSVGIKEYECSVCKKTRIEKTFVDIFNESTNVIVTTEEGEKEITVKISDVFDLEKIKENEYKLKGIKAFGEYEASDVVAINIPLGIVNVDFSSDNSTLKKLVICDGASLEIVSFSKCKALTHIEIGSAEVVFKKGCSNNVIESIKSCTEGASVNFEAQVFDGKSSFKEIKLSTKSSYIFGANSFRRTSIEEFIAPDYSDITFKNEAAFYQCNSLKYIYIGRGIEVLGGKPFDYCQYVEKVVLMDVKTISMEWTFCVQNMAEKPVEYYIHSSSISLLNNTFGQGSGIIIYTNAPITNGSAFSSCTSKSYNGIEYPAYTIVYGTPHKYEEGRIEPTCTKDGVDGFLTDCPCGEKLNGDITVQIFEAVTTNNQSYYEITYSSTIIPATGHFEDTVINIAYINGYMEYGVKDCICKVCSEEYTEVSPSATPLYIFLGYSMPEDGRLEISIGFMINNEAIDIYEKITESTVNYGVVIALESKLNGKAPLDSEVIANTQSVELDRKYCGFALKVSGFTEANLDLAVVMAIYVREGDNTVYLQSEQTNMPTSISINKYIADNAPVGAPQE